VARLAELGCGASANGRPVEPDKGLFDTPHLEDTMPQTYEDVIRLTENMVNDKKSQQLARDQGLQVLNVTWEDTGRFKDSAVGPNISDMTIQVQRRLPGSDRFDLTCMPVIRYPNFSDITGDISPDKFFVLVGNEKGQPLEKISLRQLLGIPRSYLHDPQSWKGNRSSLLAENRDNHVLVSAQACFLPIPKEGIAEFNPVLFNYQSRAGDPAVLTILATREGTSITVIDNQRDAFEAGGTWGQRLFFNQNGQRCSLTGRRKSDFLAEAQGKAGVTSSEESNQEGLNLVLLIQVPLKQREPMAGWEATDLCSSDFEFEVTLSDVEEAVIGHGKVEGPFTEIDGLDIERDDQYPVRVTVQFYKATSNGIVSEADLAQIGAQIGKVYQDADYVGSLVVEGETGRPTEHTGPKVEPPGWRDAFWRRHFENTGQTSEQAMERLNKLLGRQWTGRSAEEIEEALRQAGSSAIIRERG
jgi:hypothetical protein